MMKSYLLKMIENRIKFLLLAMMLFLFTPPLFAEWCQKGKNPPVKCKNGRWCDSIATQYCRGEKGCPCRKAKRPKLCGAQCLQDWDCLGAGKGNCTKCTEQQCSCACKAKQAPCSKSDQQLERGTQLEPEQEFRRQDYRYRDTLRDF